MANIEKIVLPDNTEYDIKDANSLPKSAGADEALTGNLYLDDSNGFRSVYFANGGTRNAKIQMQGSDGSLIMARVNSQDTSLAGVDITGENNAILFADGTDEGVILRPNGLSTTVGQVRLDANGQFHGGATLTTTTKSTSTSISSASWTTAVSATGLDASGSYVVIGYCAYTPTNNTQQQIQYKLYGNNHGNYHTRLMPLFNNWQVNLGISDIIKGDTTVSLQLYTNSNINFGTIAANATLRILRIS